MVSKHNVAIHMFIFQYFQAQTMIQNLYSPPTKWNLACKKLFTWKMQAPLFVLHCHELTTNGHQDHCEKRFVLVFSSVLNFSVKKNEKNLENMKMSSNR